MMDELLDRLRQARFDGLLDRAAGGEPLLVRSRRPETLSLLRERCSTGHLGLYVQPVPVGAGRPLACLLAAAESAGERVDDLAELTASTEMSFVIFVADARGAVEAEWRALAGAFASARRGRAAGPALLLSVDEGPTPAGCLTFDDGDLVGPAECALLAHVHRPDAGLTGRAADAAAIEVARGDEALLAELLVLGETDRFDPRAWLARQSRPAGPSPLRWRGAEAECPIWLTHEGPERLRRRIWRGHLGVLLPWLEETRATFLELNAWRLEGRGEAGLQVMDYEWGHILAAMKGMRSAPANSVDALRRLRNDLAHGSPAGWAASRGIEAHAERLMIWR